MIIRYLKSWQVLCSNRRLLCTGVYQEMKVLNVAEKNAAASTIANILSKGQARKVCRQHFYGNFIV